MTDRNVCPPESKVIASGAASNFRPFNMGDLTITRRHLPHWTLDGAWYYVTFCVKTGSLSDTEVQIVIRHIRSGHRQHYRLSAVCVMPDHVHVILRPNDGVTISRILKGIKGVTSREINVSRASTGSTWQSESRDRIVRDDTELQEKLRYMLMNPVEDGLIDDPWDFPGWFLQF